MNAITMIHAKPQPCFVSQYTESYELSGIIVRCPVDSGVVTLGT